MKHATTFLMVATLALMVCGCASTPKAKTIDEKESPGLWLPLNVA